MANEMRDRLVEIFKKIEYTPYLGSPSISNLALQFTDYALYSIVDDLIENGVFVLQCKVGQTVYMPFEGEVTPLLIVRISTEERMGKEVSRCYDAKSEKVATSFSDYHIDKTVFLTKEKAEQKLKEMRGE